MAMQNPLRLLTTATIVAVVLAAGVGGFTIWRVYDNQRLVSDSYDTKAALDRLLSAMTDAETGQRGFLLTGDPRYLEPYERGIASSHEALEYLASRTAADALRPARLDELRPLIDQKLQELAQTVELRRTEGFEAAQQIVRTGVGKATMDRIRAIVSGMDRDEDVVLSTRRVQSLVSLRTALAAETAIALSAIVLVGFLVSVSRRRDAEAAERERIALRLAAIVESSEDAMIAKDLNGTITAWNAAAERLYGYSATEAVGQSIRLIVPPDRQHEEDEVLGELRRGEFLTGFETVRLAKGGRLVDVSLTISPIKTAAGEIIGASKIARDLTPLRRYATDLEHKVHQRTSDLQAANARLEAFAFSVAHDLRAPLRGMHGLAQALLEDYGNRLDATGRDYAQRIVDEATSMDVLINDLLAYGRLSHVELAVSAVDLRDVLDKAAYTVRDDIQRSDGHVDIDRALPVVEGNRSVLIQVFANLLSNAVKFGGDRPRVHVWAEMRGPRMAHIWVEDQGIGIAPEHQERIFGVFERLHGAETYPGTGIGLAIVKKGIERLGGHVGVESQVGRGSRFWIELPRAEAA